MKTKGQLVQKIKQVRYRYQKKFLDKCLSKSSNNCIYNRPSSFDEAGVPCVSVCGYGVENRDWSASPCDKRLNETVAEGCAYFEALSSKEDLKDEFDSSLDSLPLPAIASKFPDLAALLWVLSEEEGTSDD
tara:strand:+ start:618 stop:1010 length:393 start_codon:yes stop_codon:yes gene_type:complete